MRYKKFFLAFYIFYDILYLRIKRTLYFYRRNLSKYTRFIASIVLHFLSRSIFEIFILVCVKHSRGHRKRLTNFCMLLGITWKFEIYHTNWDVDRINVITVELKWLGSKGCATLYSRNQRSILSCLQDKCIFARNEREKSR